MKLIVGLGNPGQEYAATRHNIGFQCLNRFARRQGIPFSQRTGRALVGRGTVEGVEVLLAKPRTFMNRSGEALTALVQRFQLPLGDLLVICDDLDLPLGTLRLRPRGSSGGHLGLQSIMEGLHSQDFPRLRVGIGRPRDSSGEPITDEAAIVPYVLSPFAPEERPIVEEVKGRVTEALLLLLKEGIGGAMNRFN